MKSFPWKKIGVAAVTLAIAIFCIFYFTKTTGSKQHFDSFNPAFGEYVSSYTSGVVASGSHVRIVFTKDAVDSSSVGQETSVRLFDFSPGIAGTSVWIDRRTLEFKPDVRMHSGQVYAVSFPLSKLFSVPPALGTFDYSFQIIPQNFEVTVDNIKPYVKTELKRQRIEGSLVTADFAEPHSVEQVLDVSQEGHSRKVSWTHTAEGRQHYFIVEDVERKDAVSSVTIAANGSALGNSQRFDTRVDLPALNDFKITTIKVDQSGNQRVVLQFSDPLQEKQNLEGLISIEGLSNLDFEIRDNEIRIFAPVRQNGTKKLSVEPGIKNILDYRMLQRTDADVVFEQLKPEVRFSGKGSILPATDGMVMPFESVNLKAVDLEIVQIFETNVLQFLQVNDLDGDQELRRVGKPVLKKHLQLDNAGISDLGKWNRFTLDLAALIKTQPGAIYQVRLSFKRSYLAYECEAVDGNSPVTENSSTSEDDWTSGENENSNWDSYEDYYYGDDYSWEQRDNPCNNAYYTGQHNIKRNVIASDIGLLAKRGGDGTTLIVVNDLKTTKPLGGVDVEVYDFQQQLIGAAKTNADGIASVSSPQIPFALIAKNGTQRGYMRLQDGESLSQSSFDVGGDQIKKGLKGFLYGERGVWRPGDSLYLCFMLEDKLKLLPEHHPVVFELQNPQGQVVSRQVKSTSENGFYRFTTITDKDAPTGNWTARTKVGGTEFTQPIKIEMIKPNRLKIDLNFGVDKLTTGSSTVSGKLTVNWLQGSPGKNLKAQFEVLLTRAETKFQGFPDFVFDDPTRSFSSEVQQIFEGFTDADGHAIINTNLRVSDAAPGMLNAVFRGKVFEEGGNFSVDRFSIPFYPYSSFTGIRVPPGDKARGMLLTDTTQHVDIATVDADGNKVSRDQIKMEIYKIEWRWWWDNSGNNTANFMTGQYSQPIQSGLIRTVNGKGGWDFKIKYPEWGRYLIKATDVASGHSTGKVVYIDWPGWAGRSRGGNEGATMLTFSSDKPAYAVGEKVGLVIPGSDKGRALISVENGSKVVQTFWLETKKGDNPFSFEATAEMTPNVFVSVTMLQPHAQTVNDRPMRMYGLIPVNIENPQTHLVPVITMPDVLEPGKEVVIRISEQNKRKMTYTVAVVEEGLLDLTHFKTPDPRTKFYAREALGVKTWDLYDAVIGSLGGKIERLISIGGDGETNAKEDDTKANRFKPVVKYLGPFTLDGGSNEHRFIMPQYIGSVKTMVVAGYQGAYGKAEKATPVRKPLMVLATLPRVLGPEETLKLPITLFTTDKTIHNVSVEIKTSGPVSLPNGGRRTVVMNGSDQTIEFDFSVGSETGLAKIEVTAASGSFTASDIIEINIRNPNPPITKVYSALVEPGQKWNTAVTLPGIAGTNSAVLEVSSLPPVNLGQRLKYLMTYPYGCIEQTTSSVFPQLYLEQVKVLTAAERSMVQHNVKAGIDRLRLFVTRDGGFGYWPGDQDSESWGASYAGHFLLEAESKGYFVPNDMLRRWKKYQRDRAQSWRKSQENQNGELIQAYRLYTLALTGDPELGAMNRLYEQGDLPVTASWMLAAAYVKAGQPEAAKKIISNLSTVIKPYQEMAYSYGSDLRDKAIILETLLLLNDRVRGFEILKEISGALASNSWMSTQTIAWCLKSVGDFAGKEQKSDLRFNYSWQGKDVTASTGLPLAQVNLPIEIHKSSSLAVVNTSKGSLFVRVITEGTPARGAEDDATENLILNVSYADVKGNPIDPSSLEQGTSFVATVVLTNPGLRGAYKNLALNQIFPSGWEINNLRIDESQSRLPGDIPTYQDIRDDRVYTYFDLNANQQKVFRVMLTATYAGSYYLPAVTAEAMYDHSINARKKGQVVDVTKPKPAN